MTVIKITTKTSKDEVLLNTKHISSIYHLHYDEKPGHDYARITMTNGNIFETSETYEEVLKSAEIADLF